jgi:hypothetical protein
MRAPVNSLFSVLSVLRGALPEAGVPETVDAAVFSFCGARCLLEECFRYGFVIDLAWESVKDPGRGLRRRPYFT